MNDALKFLFTPEAVAVYITTIVILAAGWISTWIQSRRGNRVVVSMESQSSAIYTSERVRTSLEIKYKGLPIDQLVLTILRITNIGAVTLNNVHLRLTIVSRNPEIDPEKMGLFVEAEVRDQLQKTTLELATERVPIGHVNFNRWVIDLQRPFLNPKRAYPEEEIELAIFSNKEVAIDVEGGGAGWYSSFVEEKRPRPWVARGAGLAQILGAFVALLVADTWAGRTAILIFFLIVVTSDIYFLPGL